MNAAQFVRCCRQWIDVRLVSYAVAASGLPHDARHRRHDAARRSTPGPTPTWPQLYGRRWEIETCFDHLKTTMGMNMLKCKSVAGVMKELAVYLLAYNLVRLAMLRAAARQGVAASRVSFVDAMRWLRLPDAGAGRGVDELIVNPDRHGRCQSGPTIVLVSATLFGLVFMATGPLGRRGLRLKGMT